MSVVRGEEGIRIADGLRLTHHTIVPVWRTPLQKPNGKAKAPRYVPSRASPINGSLMRRQCPILRRAVPHFFACPENPPRLDARLPKAGVSLFGQNPSTPLPPLRGNEGLPSFPAGARRSPTGNARLFREPRKVLLLSRCTKRENQRQHHNAHGTAQDVVHSAQGQP